MIICIHMSKRKWVIGLFIIIIIILTIIGIDYYQRKNANCKPFYVAAKNRFTGEVRNFSNPCEYSSLFWKSYPRIEGWDFIINKN